MKTKVFILLCLFLGIALTQLSAQNGKNGSGTIKFDIPVVDKYLPVYCEGVVVDLMYSPGYVLHVTQHFVNGELVWYKDKLNNSLFTSVNTDEVFKLEAGFDHMNYTKGYLNWHGNLIGNKGNNYSFQITFDTSTWEITEIHSNCHWE
jgi:hypothetical protein